MSITIKVDVSEVQRAFAQAQKQIPFAVATAVNNVAFSLMAAERAGIAATFRNPRPFTARSVFVDRATKSNPVATVRVGDLQAKYLSPFETGGVHNLPGANLTIATPVNAKPDGYGQFRKGQIARIAAMPNVFFGTVHGISGFWQRPGPVSAHKKRKGVRENPRKLKLLIAFDPNRPVNKHIDFEKRAIALVERALPSAISAAISKTLARAAR
jgi:hypothetical protein